MELHVCQNMCFLPEVFATVITLVGSVLGAVVEVVDLWRDSLYIALLQGDL